MPIIPSPPSTPTALRTELEVGGTPTTVLSLAVAPQGHLLIGTADGRVLECKPR
ncbi:hypothetical protein OHA37_08455 [Streptomyces sp. NBC_00335]|uniref:hypothetical protein n=1 Tax=unclassified Streptomyces TaxID=2593676 RepID=UPI00225269B5|nr:MULTISPECIES: hypothetical protein [unclassified Streptomyces]MCX5403913.1 hypothetical protein [Streptomyces sp. NBC_00086]